jgi:hypothetical protein
MTHNVQGESPPWTPANLLEAQFNLPLSACLTGGQQQTEWEAVCLASVATSLESCPDLWDTRLPLMNYGGPMPTYQPFGEVLRQVRKSRKVTVQSLVACLRARDYAITLAAYNAIERSARVPPAAGAFLKAVSRCLRLSHTEERDLVWHCAHDILCADLGSDAVERIIPPSR